MKNQSHNFLYSFVQIQPKRNYTDDNELSSSSLGLKKFKKQSPTIFEKASDIVEKGSGLLKNINKVFDVKNKPSHSVEKIDEENISTADVLYNRLKKIKDIKRQSEFKKQTFDILYTEEN